MLNSFALSAKELNPPPSYLCASLCPLWLNPNLYIALQTEKILSYKELKRSKCEKGKSVFSTD